MYEFVALEDIERMWTWKVGIFQESLIKEIWFKWVFELNYDSLSVPPENLWFSDVFRRYGKRPVHQLTKKFP